MSTNLAVVVDPEAPGHLVIRPVAEPTPDRAEAIVRVQAISLNTNRLMHYIELGRTYAQMGRDADARKFITKGLAMPETEKDDPETKDLGRQILKKLR